MITRFEMCKFPRLRILLECDAAFIQLQLVLLVSLEHCKLSILLALVGTYSENILVLLYSTNCNMLCKIFICWSSFINMCCLKGSNAGISCSHFKVEKND